MAEVLFTVAESLDCDGCSVQATLPNGTALPVRRVPALERRVYRTLYVTWAVTLPEPEGAPDA